MGSFQAEEYVDQALMKKHGKTLLLSLYTQDQWIIRTVERVNFVDHNTVRRRVIRHFTVPPHEAARAVVGDSCILPAFTLPKGRFISCDLRDAGDRKIALRPIEERWDLTFHTLFSVLLEADSDADKDEKLVELAKGVIKASHEHASNALRDFFAYRETLKKSAPNLAAISATEAFDKLLKYLARNYLVFAEVKTSHRDTYMISYMFDQRFADRSEDRSQARMDAGKAAEEKRLKRDRRLKGLGLIPHVYYHPWPISGAGSSHLEIEAPVGVDFGRRDIELPQADSGHKHLHSPGTSTRYARFLAPRQTPQGEGGARLQVHPGSGVMRTAGPAIAALFTFLLAVVAFSDVGPNLGATLLLILFSLTSFVAARPNEHPYVTRVVRAVRYLTLFPIPFAALAVAVLVAGWPRWLLGLLVVFGIVLTALLAIGSRRLKVRSALTELVLPDLTRVA